MQSAPAVFVCIGSSLSWRLAQSALGAVAGVSTAAWAFAWCSLAAGLNSASVSTIALGVVSMVLCAALGGALLWRASHLDAVELSWNGHTWQFRRLVGEGPLGTQAQALPMQALAAQALPMVECDVQVSWDLGAALLLCLNPIKGSGHRRLWLMCERSRLGGAWHPLRLALFGARS